MNKKRQLIESAIDEDTERDAAYAWGEALELHCIETGPCWLPAPGAPDCPWCGSECGECLGMCDEFDRFDGIAEPLRVPLLSAARVK